eukprot:629207_1
MAHWLLVFAIALAHSTSLNSNSSILSSDSTHSRMEAIINQLGVLPDSSTGPKYGFTPTIEISPADSTEGTIFKSTPSGSNRTTSLTSSRPLMKKAVSVSAAMLNITKPHTSLAQIQRPQQSYQWSFWSAYTPGSNPNLPRVPSNIPRPPSQRQLDSQGFDQKEDEEEKAKQPALVPRPPPWREYWTEERLKQRDLEQMWRDKIQPEYKRVRKEIACIDQKIVSVTSQLLMEREEHAKVLLELTEAERQLYQDVNEPYPYPLYVRNQRRLEDKITRLTLQRDHSNTRISWLQGLAEDLPKCKAQLQMDIKSMLQRLQ